MQDSNITFKVTAVGAEEATAKFNELGATIQRMTFNANGTVTASGKLTSQLNDQTNATSRAGAATDRASKSQENYFVHIAKTTVQSALVNKAFLGLVDAAGKAVKQVDLFHNFPASMAALGLSATDASASLKVLQTYIGSIGGDLTEATTSVARFAEITHNVKAATAEFIGVKNALIAGGAGADVQSNALEQLIQSYSRGVPQLIEWKSIMVAMPAQMQQVAKAMNLPNAQALGEALTKGKVNMQDFVTELTKLSTGTGPIAQQAIARMQGIEFASNVMKNALTNGLAAIYQAIGRQNIISFFNFLTQVIITLSGWAVNLINILISLFNFISKIFGGTQIAHFSGDAQSASDALGTGADNANNMADGLGNAADNAAKINKSLASFDKMNVLPDKTSGKDKTTPSGTGGLSPADASALDGIFGNIGGKMKQISEAAKIFAGILAGLLGLKFAQGILDQFNGIAKSVSDAGKNIDSLGKKLGGVGKSFSDAFKGVPKGDAESSGKGLGSAIINGLSGAVGASIGKVWKFILVPLGGVLLDILVPIGTAVAAVFIGVAEAAALPIEVLVAIAVAVVAAIVAAIWLIWTNWSTIWGFINRLAQDSWQFIQKVWDGITGFFVKLWQGIFNTIKNAIGSIENFVKSHAGLFEILFSPVIFAVALVIVVVTALIAFFKFVFDSIVSIFSAAPGFFGSIFSAAWDAITVVWNLVVAFFKAIWDGIVLIFTVVATFFTKVFTDAWNGIVLIWNIVSTWFNTNVIQPLIVFFQPVTDFLKKIFSDAWEGIKVVWNAVAGFFGGVWNGVKTAFGDVAGWFGGIFQGAWNRVTGIFSSLWSWFRDNVWNRIVSIFSSIGTTVGDAVTGAFKSVVNTVLKGVSNIWNGFIDLLNDAIKVINHLPGVNLPPVKHWSVPQLAKGGIIDQATLAMVGENGAEAVVPLENNTAWIDTLAAKLNKGTNNGQPLQLVVQIGEDKIATKVIDLINEKTQMSGRNAILV